jgi:tryptophanyl-tRNA synthetase
MSLQNPQKKMSKSDRSSKSYITLLDNPDDIAKKIRKSVTDCEQGITYDPSRRPGIANLVHLYCAATNTKEEDGIRQFKDMETREFKDVVAQVLIDQLNPIQERWKQLQSEKEYVWGVLDRGAERASEQAEQTMKMVGEIRREKFYLS